MLNYLLTERIKDHCNISCAYFLFEVTGRWTTSFPGSLIQRLLDERPWERGWQGAVSWRLLHHRHLYLFTNSYHINAFPKSRDNMQKKVL